MARKPSVQVRVHPAFAKLLKKIAREESRRQDRPVTIPEITRHLEDYLHDPLDGRCWWRPISAAELAALNAQFPPVEGTLDD